MSRLFKIEFRKNVSYPAFWIILGLHYFFLIFFLTNINNLSGSFNISTSEFNNIDISLVPVFKFPDIWQNIAYLAGFLKILLGIYMVIFGALLMVIFQRIKSDVFEGKAKRSHA